MKSRNKVELIDELQKEVRRQSEIVRTEFQVLSADKLLKTAAEGRWSVAQNLEHLNLYFEYYIPAIKKSFEKSSKNDSSTTLKSGWLGSYFTKSMDYRGKGKVKAFKDYIPIEALDSTYVLDKFLSNQDQLIQLLDTAKDYNLTKIKTPISLTKWITMKLGDVFQFVIMHNERHIVQAQSRV